MEVIRTVNVRKDRYDIYIGRTCYGFFKSKWVNLYMVGVDGNLEEVLEKYEKRVRQNLILMTALPELDGKILGCWCAPKGGLTLDDPIICHGQVLMKLVKELKEKKRSWLPMEEI